MPVMLIGHGTWDVKGEPAYAMMPRNTSITFYTENFKLLRSDNAAQITSLSQVFQAAEPSQTVEAFKTAPNYTLQKLEQQLLDMFNANLAQDVTAVFVDADTRLCGGDGTTCGDGFHDCTGLLARGDGAGQQLYWIACRHVGLEEVGGLLAGVNQGATGLGTSSGFQMPGLDASGLTDGGQAYWTDFDGLDNDTRLERWLALDPADTERLLMDDRIRSWWEAEVR